MAIGPALVLAILVGAFHSSLFVFLRGSAGPWLVVVLLAAILGAWAGDAIGARIGLDLLRIGDFRLFAASLVAWAGIGFAAVTSVLGPAGRVRR